MPTTLLIARTAVRERLDEPAARQWSDVMLNRLLNEGAKDAARKTFALMDQLDVTLTANVTEYTLTTGFGPNILQINQVEWLPGDGRRVPLHGRTREAMPAVWGHSQEQVSGEPVFYTCWGNPPVLKLKLFPAPSQNSTARLYIARLPTPAVIDTDNLDFPEGWTEILYDYAEYRAKRKDRDPDWQAAKALYDAGVSDMLLAADNYLSANREIVNEDHWFASRYQSLGWL